MSAGPFLPGEVLHCPVDRQIADNLCLFSPQEFSSTGCWPECGAEWPGCWLCHWHRRRCWCSGHCPAASTVRGHDPDPHLCEGVSNISHRIGCIQNEQPDTCTGSCPSVVGLVNVQCPSAHCLSPPPCPYCTVLWTYGPTHLPPRPLTSDEVSLWLPHPSP